MTAGKYFNRAVVALDAPHIGFVVRATDDRIVVFGEETKDMTYQFLKSKMSARMY